MDDNLMEEAPEGQKHLPEAEAQQLLTEPATKGQPENLNAFRVMTVILIHKYYPSLVKMAQRRVDQLHTIEDLSTLCRSVARYFEEPDEAKVRALLKKPVPQKRQS